MCTLRGRLAAGGKIIVMLRNRSAAVCCAIVLTVGSVVLGRAPQTTEPAARLDLVDWGPALSATDNLPRLHSLLVSLRGELSLERYYQGRRASQLANLKSVSKSVMSALVGIAIERGHIAGVGQPIADFFPELSHEFDSNKRAIAVEDLLTMRSGLESTSNRNYGAWVLSSNWVRHALTRRLIHEPGTVMDYSTGNTHLLSAILTKASGTNTRAFAQNVLAGPLGFTLPSWPTDPQGIYFGGNDMLMTPRQMLAFGELYLNRGMVGDQRVVSQRWIDRSFVPRGRSRISDQQYGYGWWIRRLGGHQTYYAWGYGGQFIFVVPDLDLVVVATSSVSVGDERRGHRRTLNEIIERLIIEPVAVAAAN